MVIHTNIKLVHYLSFIVLTSHHLLLSTLKNSALSIYLWYRKNCTSMAGEAGEVWFSIFPTNEESKAIVNDVRKRGHVLIVDGCWSGCQQSHPGRFSRQFEATLYLILWPEFGFWYRMPHLEQNVRWDKNNAPFASIIEVLSSGIIPDNRQHPSFHLTLILLADGLWINFPGNAPPQSVETGASPWGLLRFSFDSVRN